MRLCPCAGARPCFNPRAHEGRDLAIRTSPSCVRTFQSTRPRGARRPMIAAGRGQISVSIHAPTRGATSTLASRSYVDQFQSTRPRGARRRTCAGASTAGCFNPRAHEGRDGGEGCVARRFLVSIHAPTRGATTWPAACRATRIGFNPRAHEGRDTRCSGWASRDRGFNPRAHEGRDDESRHRRLNCVVSIHAPTRGATRRRPAPCRWRPCFNPRAHEGRDLVPPGSDLSSARFQSTRPRGARPGQRAHLLELAEVSIHAPTRGATSSCAARCAMETSFNPRAHEGRDLRHRTSSSSSARFNPRAHEGRDPRKHPRRGPRDKFQSTRPRGARPSSERLTTASALVSIHAPTRGATKQRAANYRVCLGFNPRAHEGRDRSSASTATSPRGFNPRAHEGRDTSAKEDAMARKRFNPRAHEGRD